MSPFPDVHPLVVTALLEDSRRLRSQSAASAQIALKRGQYDRADGIRHVLAAGAQLGGTWLSVVDIAKRCTPSELSRLEQDSAPWWRALGQITLLHGESLEDEFLAAEFFAVGASLDGHRSLNLREYFAVLQAAWDTGSLDVFAEESLKPAPIASIEREFIALDLVAAEHGSSSQQWLDELNFRIFAPHNLAPIHFNASGRTLYDRIASKAPKSDRDGPLITVVMTTFRRHEEILTSVHSILGQSWSDFELLVVDDASGPEFEPLLQEVEALDERIRVIRQTENSGTYVCRNRALTEARGEFVTFQDDDDWSHPQRLEYQVKPMLASASIHSTLSRCVRANEDLHFRYAAVPASRMNSSSLMFRRRDMGTLGGFDPVRKGGDSEFIMRLCEALPGEQVVIPEILAVVRLTQGSLSRTDFSAGWNHPSRSEYREAAEWWHSRMALGVDPAIDTSRKTRSFPAPRRFLGTSEVDAMRADYDLVLVGDFATNTPWASVAWNQLQFAREKYRNVGIIQLNAPARQTGRPTRIAPEVRALIHAGEVDRILPTDHVHSARLLVCEAPVVELQDTARWNLECERATVLADTLPAESGVVSFWSVHDVLASLERMFGISSTNWLSADTDVRHALQGAGQMVQAVETDFYLHTRCVTVAKRFPGAVPVVGRCAPESRGGWPTDRDLVKRAYPDSAHTDVRIFGETRSFREVNRSVPARWLWFEPRLYAFATFIQQVDFYVYFGDEAPSTFERRAMLAAMAAGRVVVVDEKYEDIFGVGAICCGIDDLNARISSLQRDPTRYAAQVDRAHQMLNENFDGDGLVSFSS